MIKVHFLNWEDLCKTIQLKSTTKEFQLKSSASLISRLLVIAKSERNVDLQSAISIYEFHPVNQMLMKPDGSLLPCKSKSDLIHCLEKLVSTEENTESERATAPNRCYLVIDGMAVVQALMHAQEFETCKELGRAFTQRIDALLVNYVGGRIIFDNYRKQLSIKDQIRYGLLTGTSDDLNINDATPITNTNKFLASKNNKDQLTFFFI
jgi:hypothetical protein